MKNLLLMRHGDAQPASVTNGRDHDRPLIPRGRDKCTIVAKYLAQHNMLPEVILASSATRCIQSGEEIIQQLGLSISILSLPELYNAGEEVYFGAVQQLSNQYSTALLIGHNPIIQGFTQAMRKGGANVGSFDCAAMACIRLASQTWRETSYLAGNCLWFVTPGDAGLLQQGGHAGMENQANGTD